MSTADKLIADRGHGLSARQKQVLGGIARGEVARVSIVDVTYDRWQPAGRWAGRSVGPTVRALLRLGLVALEPTPDVSGFRLWKLTYPDGYTLAERMGLIERQDMTAGSPGDLYDPQEVSQ